MLTIQGLSHLHSNKELLFQNLNLSVNRYDKIALIGNNGSGKSTLLKVISGELKASGGSVELEAPAYVVPQIFGQYNHLTVAEALAIDDKLHALNEILSGNVTEQNYQLLNDDWTIEERCTDALEKWQLRGLSLSQKMGNLSGGQKTKVFLAGTSLHQPEFVLLDEPSNHLDVAGRELLYQYIESTASTLIVVSHDKKLLQLLDTVCELSSRGIVVYGGNYDFYTAQKQLAGDALSHTIQSREKALRKAREKERETAERQQKLDARGKKKQENAGVSRIMMNTLRNSAENSSSKIKDVHAEKIEGISEELQELRSTLSDNGRMRFGFDHSAMHKGKVLCTASQINFVRNEQILWPENKSFEITSGERVALKGANGSGKTTLISAILGELEPNTGQVIKAFNKSVYIDQDYSLINNTLEVYEQAQQFNNALQEHEIKIRLSRFLFPKEVWGKHCAELSGGEKMRLCLACLTIAEQSPDVIILDEPTNNLDMQHVEILADAISEYQGTLIVVSHDEYFLRQIRMERILQL